MKELSKHIRSGSWHGYYTPEEMGHALVFIYDLLLWAERDGADKIYLAPDQFVWFKQDKIIGSFPVNIPQPQPSFKENLDLVLERDAIVKLHIEVDKHTPYIYIIKS
jgi:hypothetical protein